MRAFLRPLLLAVGGGAILLAGCSSDGEATSEPTVTSSESSSSDDFNDADVVFAQGMIPHHNEALEMAAMALASNVGASAEIREIASQIQAAQDPEILQMSSLLAEWDQPIEMQDMKEGAGMEGMGESMSAEDMLALAALRGFEFDAAWATAMIAHHEGAVSMAETVKESGSNPEVSALADANYRRSTSRDRSDASDDRWLTESLADIRRAR